MSFWDKFTSVWVFLSSWKKARSTYRLGRGPCPIGMERSNSKAPDGMPQQCRPCRCLSKKEDGNLPLGSCDDADHARGKDHHGLPCQAGVFGQRGREFGAAFVHSFLNSVYNWSRDAELVSFPAFECFPGWSFSRINS